MPVPYIRAIQPGTNANDMLVNQIHMNRTALTHYNDTLYTNGTLSKGTNCYLAFANLVPPLHVRDERVLREHHHLVLRTHPPRRPPRSSRHGLRAALRGLDYRLDGESAQARCAILARG